MARRGREQDSLLKHGALGILTHITEMDVQCSKCTAARLATQAQIYGAMLTACLSVPSCRSFETWGFTDKYSWLGSAVAPLPFDANFGGKPAFDQLLAQSLEDGFNWAVPLRAAGIHAHVAGDCHQLARIEGANLDAAAIALSLS